MPVIKDNQGAVQFAQNPITNSNSKHIDVGHHFLRELVGKKKIPWDTDYLRTATLSACGLSDQGHIAGNVFSSTDLWWSYRYGNMNEYYGECALWFCLPLCWCVLQHLCCWSPRLIIDSSGYILDFCVLSKIDYWFVGVNFWVLLVLRYWFWSFGDLIICWFSEVEYIIFRGSFVFFGVEFGFFRTRFGIFGVYFVIFGGFSVLSLLCYTVNVGFSELSLGCSRLIPIFSSR